MRLIASLLILIALVDLGDFTDLHQQPEHVHLSYGVGYSQMVVSWSTVDETKTSTVEYGLEPFSFDLNQTGTSVIFAKGGDRNSSIHTVILKDLKPNTDYYYHVGDYEGGWSDMFRFRTRPQGDNWSVRLAVYGDLGNQNDISIPFLQHQVSKNAYDAILHVGDFAYNLQSNDGKIGDEFMQQIEPIAAYVPYQTVVGNHEDDGRNFSDYQNRFTMIDESTGEKNNLFYSFNVGPAHIVGFSSEFYYYLNYGFTQIHTQFEWLERDLREANKPENRAKRPWIITMAHRPMYCSTDDPDDCSQNESILRKGIPIVNQYGLEDLFYKYNVDIYIGAHEHTYERLFPVYDRKIYNGTGDNPYNKPKAPVHLLGCDEHLDQFVPNPKPWSAKRISKYGVTELNILNGTHIRVRQRNTEFNAQVVDMFTLVKGDWTSN